MKNYTWILKILIVMLPCSIMWGTQSAAQQATNSLYLQTSEMADAIIQYDADKASINRFYSASGSQGDFFLRQQGN